ncbi:hypothetical protein [Lutibacter maritimus]|uniref:Uncharacterized protein n=1 Tax=Lutibacter maritimus TaxID=593133 RepID=A0A1I6NYR9_9FLAO|nr:hypothetical protein [Lutibacter maritimus]SFS33077.1 hypothetical protein SAMN04488006_0724 [Lutibacter maritimus]
MGKIGAFILSFTILFQSFNFEIDDVYKLPTLINHITCHIENGDNFGNFIDLHYGNKSNSHQEKHKEHKDLPFKHQHSDSHMQLFVMNNLKLNVSNLEIGFNTKNFIYKEPTSNQFTNNFLQPPQK